MPEFKVERENVSFWLRVKPRAARERLTVDAAGELRLELHAPQRKVRPMKPAFISLLARCACRKRAW
jgi:hypothetical protein